MGKAVGHIFSDPLDAAVDPFGLTDGKLKQIADPLNLDSFRGKLFGGDSGGSLSKDAISAALGDVAGQAGAAPSGAAPSPYRRPLATPITAESAKLDRRRSIASSLRRRRTSGSILTGTAGDAADALGAA